MGSAGTSTITGSSSGGSVTLSNSAAGGVGGSNISPPGSGGNGGTGHAVATATASLANGVTLNTQSAAAAAPPWDPATVAVRAARLPGSANATSGSGAVQITYNQTGGKGGAGSLGANGGAGAATAIANAVTGSTTGALGLRRVRNRRRGRWHRYGSSRRRRRC